MSWYAGWPPAPTAAAPSPAPAYPPLPPNRLGVAILCTLFCFTPFGIVALVKATSVKRQWMAGRYVEARRASRSAKNWCILAALVWPGLLWFFACTGMMLMTR